MKKYPLWIFIGLPAIIMLLGWGLRGFIGGGPFGAMIPGAMLMLSICMLLGIPFAQVAVMVVFGTAGIGMGGEMTYGQTLGFLRNPDTVWWGTCGTTVKGGVWGLVGGTFIALGLVHSNIKTNTIITALLIFLTGFIVGLKLINDPKLIYFSDPVNKPRQESWAGLLFGAIALLTWLKITVTSHAFRLIFRFAGYGLMGGAVGFGLGGFWLVVGFQLGKNTWITEWWKLMEFSFGCLMGGFFGFSAWLSRNEIKGLLKDKMEIAPNVSFVQQWVLMILLGFLIYLVIPLAEPFVEVGKDDGFVILCLRTIARLLVNYTFIGSLLILVALRWPFVAFQIAVTLTFSHTVIDLVEDMGSKHILLFTPVVNSSIVLLASSIISFLVAKFQRKEKGVTPMFLVLVWSTVAVAIIRMILYNQFQKNADDSLLKFFIGDLLVFNFFVMAAVVVSVWAVRRIGADTRLR